MIEAHSVLRRMTMTREIKSEIQRQLTIQIVFFKIIFFVRLSTISEDSADNFDFALINSLIKTRDVYNIKTQMRRNELEFMTSM